MSIPWMVVLYADGSLREGRVIILIPPSRFFFFQEVVSRFDFRTPFISELGECKMENLYAKFLLLHLNVPKELILQYFL